MNQILQAMDRESSFVEQEQAELIATVSEMQLALRRGAPSRSLDAMLARLITYFRGLFRREEQALSGDPAKSAAQRAEQEKLLEQLTSYRQGLGAGEAIDGVAVMRNLKHWILTHSVMAA